MRVRARLFAVQRELAGTREVALDLPDGATIEDGWAALVGLFPVLAPGRSSVRFARNGEYADAASQLAEGDELACIPPVSGGSGEARDDAEPIVDDADPGDDAEPSKRPGRILELREQPFPADLAEQLSARLATPADGAVVIFVGRTRVSPGTPAPGQEAEAARHAGRAVDALEYEAHEPMALAILERIADEIAERFGVVRLAIVHRTGPVPLGETSILVVAASPHRDAAFDAARYAIDETKVRAPIWKAERFADGHVWIGAPARTGQEAPSAVEPVVEPTVEPAASPPPKEPA
jgi:molybdopterin synthase catalytic subunit